MRKRSLAIGICTLLICSGFIPISLGFNVKVSKIEEPTIVGNGKILYVGGSGSGNYTKIQDAINDASNGDTIYVYEKTYYENLYVNKSINIIGQNRENTIIDGSHVDTHTIHLVTDEINISNFRFYNDVGPQWELAFYISSDNCYISDCTIYTNVKNALGIESASYNTFFNCSIHTTTEFGGGDAIRLMSSYNTFINCEIYNNRRHGALISGSYNTFLNCNVHGNGESGVRIYGNNNFFSGCNFYENGIGFKIDESRNHQILNCIIHDNRYDGIRLWQYHPKNVTIRNCEIYNNKNNGINIIQDTVETTVDNCRIYNNGNGISIGDDSLYTSINNTKIYDNNYGIYIYDSRGNTINGNNINSNKKNGIYLKYASSNNIMGNTILNNDWDGIYLNSSSNNTITGNTIIENIWWGIHLFFSSSNTFIGNTISKNDGGMHLQYSISNTITGNTISNNMLGIWLFISSDNTIIKNNFLDNDRDAYFRSTPLTRSRWKQNYWNRPRILPKLIYGEIEIIEGLFSIPWFDIDWSPAKTPYTRS